MVRWVCLSRVGELGWSHFFALSCQNSHGQGSHRVILQKDTNIKSATKMFKQICSDMFTICTWDFCYDNIFAKRLFNLQLILMKISYKVWWHFSPVERCVICAMHYVCYARPSRCPIPLAVQSGGQRLGRNLKCHGESEFNASSPTHIALGHGSASHSKHCEPLEPLIHPFPCHWQRYRNLYNSSDKTFWGECVT